MCSAVVVLNCLSTLRNLLLLDLTMLCLPLSITNLVELSWRAAGPFVRASAETDYAGCRASIFLEETSTVLVFDIKSSIVRVDDEAGKEETTTRNAMIDACMEKKITAADNFNPRGVNTINLILKSKQVQETAPMSVENSFQVYEFDIFDAFADAPTDDLVSKAISMRSSIVQCSLSLRSSLSSSAYCHCAYPCCTHC